MKKFLLVAVVVAGVLGMVMVAGAATSINNWCTSTYRLTGGNTMASGSDSAVVARQTQPNILVEKIATNLRTGQIDPYMVNAVQFDTIQFTLIWSNTGEADADTIVISDPIPAGLTYVAASVSDTETADAVGSAVYSAGTIIYTGTSVDGTDATASNGQVKFSVTVN